MDSSELIPSDDEILFTGKDPEARLAAMKEDDDNSDWTFSTKPAKGKGKQSTPRKTRTPRKARPTKGKHKAPPPPVPQSEDEDDEDDMIIQDYINNTSDSDLKFAFANRNMGLDDGNDVRYETSSGDDLVQMQVSNSRVLTEEMTIRNLPGGKNIKQTKQTKIVEFVEASEWVPKQLADKPTAFQISTDPWADQTKLEQSSEWAPKQLPDRRSVFQMLADPWAEQVVQDQVPVVDEDSESEDDEESDDDDLNEADNNGLGFLQDAINAQVNRVPLDAMDLMNLDRPQRKRQKKGKLAVPQVSDEELQQKMLSTWSNDRAKKKARKQEREALREAGLLKFQKKKRTQEDSDDEGPNPSHGDLKERYPRGMNIDELRFEFREFCESDQISLALPPFDPWARKALHSFINKLGLKSKSFGKAEKRYVVVTKKHRGFGFDHQVFAQFERSARRSFFPRADVKQPAGISRPYRMASSSGHKNVKVRPGETIGAGAPEIGTGTGKGVTNAKRMMEKMGWTDGQGLGSMENKGRTEPVEQVMWFSRAGLG
ncbi:hypothetical protein BT63DRAFT_427142 [Microthyrium microscopicum]|uniref:Protein SQS1 n=1 Tax=Microthyrium microscopicum TaxID=703497 RepID=A0A6A6U3K0_9PEZI|nr:hypothetical protein BT63DRAFT_427142 [Microthyrium microscopicum]